MQCPNCAQTIRLIDIRSKFICSNCGKSLKGTGINAAIYTPSIVLAVVPFTLGFPDNWLTFFLAAIIVVFLVYYVCIRAFLKVELDNDLSSSEEGRGAG